MITVGQLRKVIEELPDDAPVLVKPSDSAEFQSNMTREDFRNLPRWVVPWRYDTRNIYNAYRANDDRYDQNSVLILELGGLSNESD